MLARIGAIAVVGLLLGAPVAAAQQGRARDSVAVQQRAALEGQVRQRIAAIVKQRLGLTDAQAQQLHETEARFDLRRRDLMQRERRVRQDLRRQLAPSVAPNQQRVAALLDQIMAIHRERVTMTEQEQRDLARFLTPIQRAQYLGLQTQLRSRIEGMRQGRGRAGQPQRAPMRRPPPRP